MAIQSDETLVTKGDLKELYQDKILPYLGGNAMLATNVGDYYNTDEKIVGVWVNGKPLYQKTVLCHFANSITEGTDIYERTPIGNNNLDFAYVYDWFFDMTTWKVIMNNTAWGCIMDTVSNKSTACNCWASVIYSNDSYDIRLGTNRHAFEGMSAYVTVRYTKSTDAANSAVATPGCYDLNRPDLWPENKEIFFGNGLYGQKFVGTLTSAASTRILSHIYNYPIYLVSYGGYVTYNQNGDTMMLGYHQDDTNYVCGLYAHANDGLYLFTKSAAARTNAPYNIWVTYTK